MKRKNPTELIPLYDYRCALRGAELQPRLIAERAPYFAEPRRWHPAVIAGALAKAKS
jgi:hypothetical protein